MSRESQVVGHWTTGNIKSGFGVWNSEVGSFIEDKVMFNIVLVEPEIPPNTGNI